MIDFKNPSYILTVENLLNKMIKSGFTIIHNQSRTFILHEGKEIDSIDNIDIHYLNLDSHATYRLFNVRLFANSRKKITALGYKNEINFITFRTAIKVMARRTVNDKSKPYYKFL